MKHILLAGLTVLAASTDWALEPAGICAKDQRSCEDAVRLYRRGDVFSDLGRRALECRPHPGCFTPQSEVIRGYNDR